MACKLPAIPFASGLDQSVKRILDPIKETLDVWAGRVGNDELCRVVTVEDLLDEAVTVNISGGGGGGVTVHSALTGLSADDHTQYLLVDGTRPMAGDLDMDGNLIVTEQYITENGFPNRTDSVITITDGTRTFQVAPAVTSFDFWSNETQYTKSSAQTVVWPDTEGIHYFYFDSTGTLATTTTFVTDLLEEFAWVGFIYWDATNNESIINGDERHGRVMDAATHAHFHEAFGTQWISGLALADFDEDGTGNLDSNAQFSVGNGVIRDEDLRHTIADDDPQDLYPAVNAPIYYRDGASGDWRKIAATAFTVDNTGTANGRLNWNEDTGATWQLTEATNGYYVNTHIVATNCLTEPMIVIMGQAQYQNGPQAREGALTELLNLSLGALEEFAVEWKAIATVLFQTGTAYTNTVQARVVTADTVTGDIYIDWRESQFSSGGGGVGVTNHGLLSGLADDDHTQYSLVDGSRDYTGAITVSEATTFPAASLYLENTTTSYAGINFQSSASTEGVSIYANETLLYFEGNSTTDKADITFSTGAGKTFTVQVGGANYQTITSSGMTLRTGGTVDEIVTTLTGVGAADQLVTADAIEGYTDSAITTHEGAADPHTVYQLESEKSAASGYASLDSSTLVPTAELGTGTADATTYLRGDQTWATAGGLFTEDATSYSIVGGTDAGAALLTTGIHNFFAGNEAGNQTTSGDYNFAVGKQSLYENQTGTNNIAIGNSALKGHSTSTSSTANIALGSFALQNATNAVSYNVAIGYIAGQNITGANSVYVGWNAAAGNATQSSAAQNNVSIGAYSFYSIDGSDNNVVVGYDSARYGSTASGIVCLGTGAAKGIPGTLWTGGSTVAVGYNAANTIEGNAQQHVFLGNNSGQNVTTAIGNTGVGYNTLRYIEDGGYNVALGSQAFQGKSGGYTGTTPNNNLAIGYNSFAQPDDGASYNIAIGNSAGYYNYGGDFSTFIGYYAGFSAAGTTTNGSYVVGIGYNAFRNYVGASSSTAIGSNAFGFTIGGTNNTAIGLNAGQYMNRDATDNGYSNTLIGASAGKGTATGENDYYECTFIGSSSGLNHKTGFYNTGIGSGTLRQGGLNSYNVAIGVNAGYYLEQLTSTFYATENVFIGTRAGFGVSTSTTEIRHNICIGHETGEILDGTSGWNLFMGYQAGNSYGTGINYAIGIGYQALESQTGTGQNVAIGYQSMRGISAATFTCDHNTAVGNNTLSYIDTATGNTAIGKYAGYFVDTSSNNFLGGYQAAEYLAGGNGSNVVVGKDAGYGSTVGPGYSSYDNCTVVGSGAGYDLLDSTKNTLIGALAGENVTTGDSNLILGYGAGNDLTTEDDQLRIGNNTTGPDLIEGDFSEETVTINGSLETENMHFCNYALNGSCLVWQRGTSINHATATTGFSADRVFWSHDSTNGTGTITQSTFTAGQTSVPGEPLYYLTAAYTVAPTGQTYNAVTWKVEDVRALAGQEVTLSVYAKADTTRSVTGGYNQNFGSGGSSAVLTDFGSAWSLTTSWQRFTETFTMPSISGKTIGTASYISFEFNLPLNSTYTIDISNVQVVVGSLPLPFRYEAYNETLQLCKRYYEVQNFYGQTSAVTTTQHYYTLNYTVQKWYAPTITYASTQVYDGTWRNTTSTTSSADVYRNAGTFSDTVGTYSQFSSYLCQGTQYAAAD